MIGSAIALLLALAGTVAAQTTDDANATETGVTPEDRPDSELPTERESMGDVPEREPENEVSPDFAAEDGGGLVYSLVAVLGTIAISVLALIGIAYAAYQREARR